MIQRREDTRNTNLSSETFVFCFSSFLLFPSIGKWCDGGMNLFINSRDGVIHIPNCFLGRFPDPATKMSLKRKMSIKGKSLSNGKKSSQNKTSLSKRECLSKEKNFSKEKSLSKEKVSQKENVYQRKMSFKTKKSLKGKSLSK